MPTMLRTSKKAQKIAEKINGVPVTAESKRSKRKNKEIDRQVMRSDFRMAR